MEKTKKRILGFLCLVATIVITIIAANIPVANTSATGGTNTNITLRVVGPIPNIDIINSPFSIIESPIPIVIDPIQAVTFICEHVDPVNAGITYRPYGEITESDIVSQQIFSSFEDYQPCEHILNLNLDDYGYGNFVVNIQGDGKSGFAEDSVAFEYSALVITAEQENPGEDPIANLYYDDEVVDTIVITILDENGNEIPGVDPITVSSGTHEVELPFAANDLKSGKYIIKATPYDEVGNVVPNRASDTLDYIAPDLEVPNTGGIFGALNFSRTDYLATGIIVTVAAAGGALFFLSKRKKDSKKH